MNSATYIQQLVTATTHGMKPLQRRGESRNDAASWILWNALARLYMFIFLMVFRFGKMPVREQYLSVEE